MTFVELSGVPFKLTACSEGCLKRLMEKYGEMNIELQKNMDQAYEESIKQALKEAEEKGEVLPTHTPPPGWAHIKRGRHRRHKKKRCSIM